MGSYLDNAATTMMSAVALEAYLRAAEQVGNPSSLHSYGRAARRLVEDARESIAADLDAHPTEVIFTSGGTEANNLAVKGIFWGNQLGPDRMAGGSGCQEILISAIEHHSVIEPAQWLTEFCGARLNQIPVSNQGVIDLKVMAETIGKSRPSSAQLSSRALASSAAQVSSSVQASFSAQTSSSEKASSSALSFSSAQASSCRQLQDLNASQIALVSVMLANNEVGSIQPLRAVVELAKPAGIPVHTDAVAAIGHIPVSFRKLGVDAMSVSAHKLGGPGGVGALVTRRELRIQPLLHGGGQEREVRSGTLDVPAIAGFVAALRETTANMAASSSSLSQLRNELIQGVLATIPDAHLQGAVQHETLRLPAVSQHGDKGRFAQDDDKRIVEQEDALPGLALFTFLGADPDALLFGLDQAGIAASIGAACTAGVAAPSHVLLASGVPEVEARSALRFSLGANTSLDEVQHLLQVLPGVVARARI